VPVIRQMCRLACVLKVLNEVYGKGIRIGEKYF